tara:strand:+ start:985 stop:1689 length:705 start_codon:yes stop_codon:yes gene_type:complete
MGFQQQQLNSRSFFSIRGAPDKARFINLNLQGPSGSPDNIPLSIAGPSAGSIPLVIGVTRYGSGEASFYTSGSIGSVPSASGYQGYMNLAISATPNESLSSTTTLQMQAPAIGYTNLGQTFVFPQLPSGGYFASSDRSITVALEGGVTSAAGSLFKTVGLNIQNRVSDSSSATLVIDKDFNYSNNISFHMQSQSGIGDLAFVIDGINGISNTATFTVKTKEVEPLTIYTSGYLE